MSVSLGGKVKSKSQIKQQQRRRKQIINWAIGGGLAVIVLVGLGFALRRSPESAVGESVAVMSNLNHVEEGTDPGPYSTDPPTSGPHYASQLNAGFYEANDQQPPYPAGYLVHSLEHGYVIFWYNCSAVSDQECSDLKTDIQSVMDQENNFKVIAYPWPSIDVPVVMTSWGKVLEFDKFDPGQARDFVLANRNKAPEPNAP
jgi:hypothetical protein